MYSKQFKDLFVLYRVVSLEVGVVDGQTGQSSGFAFGDHDCKLKLGHIIASFFS